MQWNLRGGADLMEHLNLIATTDMEDMTCRDYKPQGLIYKQPMKGGALCEQTLGVLFNDSEGGWKKIPAPKKLWCKLR